MIIQQGGFQLIRIKNIIGKTIEFVLIIFITLITILILSQIVFRSLGFQMLWISEIVRYIFVYLVFLGSSIAINQKGHVVIESVVEKLPQKLKSYVSVLAHILVIVFLIFLIWSCTTLIDTVGQSESVTMSWFKMSYLYLGVLISSVLMILYSVCEVFISVSHVPEEGEK